MELLSFFRWSRLNIFIFCWMQKDCTLCTLLMMFMPLWPIIRSRVRENTSIVIKCSCRNGHTNTRRNFQSLLWVFIPKIKAAIATCSWKSSINRMKRNIIHWINILIISMTFKREIVPNFKRINYAESLSSTYCIPTLPSIEPTANPLKFGKQDYTISLEMGDKSSVLFSEF